MSGNFEQVREKAQNQVKVREICVIRDSDCGTLAIYWYNNKTDVTDIQSQLLLVFTTSYDLPVHYLYF